MFRYPDFHVLVTAIMIVLSGAFLAFLLTVSEYLLVANISSLALSIASILKVNCEFFTTRWKKGRICEKHFNNTLKRFVLRRVNFSKLTTISESLVFLVKLVQNKAGL